MRIPTGLAVIVLSACAHTESVGTVVTNIRPAVGGGLTIEKCEVYLDPMRRPGELVKSRCWHDRLELAAPAPPPAPVAPPHGGPSKDERSEIF
jgi:hypothetical protein